MDISNYTNIISEETRALLNKVDDASVGRLFRLLQDSDPTTRIFCTASGRSGYVLHCFCMRLMHLGYQSHFVGETVTPPINMGDVMIVLSGSGETSWTLSLVDRAQKAQASVFGIVGNNDSPVAQSVDDAILLASASKTGPSSEKDFSDQPLGSLFEQTAFLLLESIVLAIYQSLGSPREALRDRHANLE